MALRGSASGTPTFSRINDAPVAFRLWAWCDEATLAELANVFWARGVRFALRHPAWARLPAIALT